MRPLVNLRFAPSITPPSIKTPFCHRPSAGPPRVATLDSGPARPSAVGPRPPRVAQVSGASRVAESRGLTAGRHSDGPSAGVLTVAPSLKRLTVARPRTAADTQNVTAPSRPRAATANGHSALAWRVAQQRWRCPAPFGLACGTTWGFGTAGLTTGLCGPLRTLTPGGAGLSAPTCDAR